MKRLALLLALILISISPAFSISFKEALSEQRRGNIEGVADYIESGGDVNRRDSRSNTLLINAVLSNEREIAALLIENGADVNCVGLYGFSPLTYASRYGFFEIAELY